MSNRALVNPKPVERGRLTIESLNRQPHVPVAYNRSSLAVELDSSFVEELKPLPRLVPMPAGHAAAFAGVPTFMALDRATQRKDPAAKALSGVIHVVAIAAILWLGFKAHNAVVAEQVVTPVSITLYAPPPPPKVLPVAPKMGGGGGGGAHQIIEPTKGNPPRIVAKMPVTPPQILRVNNPKLAVEPTEMVKMPENPNLPNMG